MSEEKRRYDMPHGTATAVKRGILGNIYIVIIYPTRHDTQTVMVYADTVNGDDLEFPESLYGSTSLPKALVKRKIPEDGDTSAEVAELINEAVVKLEDHLEDTSCTEDAVLGALDANKEVHEDR